MATSAVIGWRILFLLLACTMVSTLAYTLVTDGSPFRKELLSRLMVAVLVDFYLNVTVIAAWVCYKESNWIAAAIWIVFLVCLGSIATCAYILWQLWQLSSQESFEDIMYSVLIRDTNKNGVQQPRKHSNIMIARIVFGAMSCLMVVTLAYLFSDGSPFNKDLYTPWLVATLIDFYINGTAISVWMFYKEESWLTAFIWIVLFIIFGSASSCSFIVKELFKLNSDDPAYLVLFKNSNRKLGDNKHKNKNKIVIKRSERRYERTSSS
ncbi:uncharacterized protein LOC101218847 isoform X2 [Cucumis sativus]|uniref:uncharacterized protein LOC101218847 isoform X2 n=1 Tax=Cucumis sativus TaxID=3659 RepID=UPI0012F48F4A|nr:uncharacterized protein LOC101218847 isoform X2 [Cucumis sativus]